MASEKTFGRIFLVYWAASVVIAVAAPAIEWPARWVQWTGSIPTVSTLVSRAGASHGNGILAYYALMLAGLPLALMAMLFLPPPLVSRRIGMREWLAAFGGNVLAIGAFCFCLFFLDDSSHGRRTAGLLYAASHSSVMLGAMFGLFFCGLGGTIWAFVFGLPRLAYLRFYRGLQPPRVPFPWDA